MSGHAAFRRQPVPGEMALQHQTVTLPAPIRGIIEVENWAYTKPGCATILDNWFPTQKGLRSCAAAPSGGVRCRIRSRSSAPGFEYVSGAVKRMFAATGSRLFDVTFADSPVSADRLSAPSPTAIFPAAQLANTGRRLAARRQRRRRLRAPLQRHDLGVSYDVDAGGVGQWRLLYGRHARARHRRPVALEMRHRAHQSRHRHVCGGAHRKPERSGRARWRPTPSASSLARPARRSRTATA